MKSNTILGLLLASILAITAILIAGTGCTTASKPAANAATIELAIGVASDAAALVLQKNPKATPVLRSVSSGITAVLTESSLTPARVKAFVDVLGKDANLTPAERIVIGRAVQRVHGILIAYFGTPDLNIADPRVRSALEKVKQSIDDTLALAEVLGT